MNISNKNLDQSDVQLDSSTISTRNSAKRSKLNTSQRSTITRKQAKEKDLVNGHNEVIFVFFRESRNNENLCF
jgi:uncharacterized protein YjdB